MLLYACDQCRTPLSSEKMASCFLSLVKTNFELFIVKMECKFSLLNKVFHKWTAFFVFQPYHSIVRREITGVVNVPVLVSGKVKEKTK